MTPRERAELIGKRIGYDTELASNDFDLVGEIEATVAQAEQEAVAATLELASQHQRVSIPGPEHSPGIISRGACSCGSAVADGVTPYDKIWADHIRSLRPDVAAWLALVKAVTRLECAKLVCNLCGVGNMPFRDRGWFHGDGNGWIPCKASAIHTALATTPAGEPHTKGENHE